MRKIAHFWRDAAVFFEFLKIAPKWRSEEERIRRARRRCPCYGVPLGLGDGWGLTAGDVPPPLLPLMLIWRGIVPSPPAIASTLRDCTTALGPIHSNT